MRMQPPIAPSACEPHYSLRKKNEARRADVTRCTREPRAKRKAASGPTNNNVLASASYVLRAVSTGAAAGTELLGRSAERALAPSTRK